MSADRRAAIYLVITAAGFGGTWVAAPWATDDLPPLTVACLRFSLAAVLLLGWCLARGPSLRVRRSDLPVILGVAATSVVGYNLLFLYGVTLAPASHGSILVPGLIPLATLALSRAVHGTPMARRQVVGGLTSIAGLALVVGPELGGGGSTLLGDGLFVISATVWSAYTLIGRAARLEPVVLTLYGAALGAVAFAVPGFVASGGAAAIGGASARALLSVAYLGSIGTVLSFVTYLLGVRLIGPARATAYAVLIPIFGYSLTVVLLGEPVTPLALVGVVIVLVGLRVTQSAPATRSPA